MRAWQALWGGGSMRAWEALGEGGYEGLAGAGGGV